MRDRSNVLLISLLAYAAASFFHHVHNAEFLDEYPNMPAWLTPAGVYAAWLAVNLVGLAGYAFFRWKYRLAGLGLLGIYSALGLYGLAHYGVAPLAAHTLTMHLTIGAEAITAALLLTIVILECSRLRPEGGST